MDWRTVPTLRTDAGQSGSLPPRAWGKRKDPSHCGGPLVSRRTGYWSVVPAVTRASEIKGPKQPQCCHHSRPSAPPAFPSKLENKPSAPGPLAPLGPANRPGPLREVGVRWRRLRFPGGDLRVVSACASSTLDPSALRSAPCEVKFRGPLAVLASLLRGTTIARRLRWLVGPKTSRRWCIPWLLGTSRTLEKP